MGEQDLHGRRAGVPVGMGIPAAGDQGCQWQARLSSACLPCGHVESHRGTLGEAEHGRTRQGHARSQVLQSPAQVPASGRQRLPVGLGQQVVPLPTGPGRVGKRCPQRHHTHLGPHQEFGKVEQVIGIGTPAMQQHQPAVSGGGSPLDGAGFRRGRLPGPRRLGLPIAWHLGMNIGGGIGSWIRSRRGLRNGGEGREGQEPRTAAA